jgi:hypothetical protein
MKISKKNKICTLKISFRTMNKNGEKQNLFPKNNLVFNQIKKILLNNYMKNKWYFNKFI